jgi:hypothetical protein
MDKRMPCQKTEAGGIFFKWVPVFIPPFTKRIISLVRRDFCSIRDEAVPGDPGPDKQSFKKMGVER